MATPSSLQPEPTLVALPTADRKKIHIVLRHPLPEMHAGQSMLLDVQLSNDATQSISSDHPLRVLLAYHWVKPDGSYELFAGKRTRLPDHLPSGGQCNLEMRVTPPAEPGKYELQVGLLQEGISWFETSDPQHLQKVTVNVVNIPRQSRGL
tara:strand:- start:14 stop:466 length:453 start_codon:yes stop_codon:yes gene_type:complete